MEWTNNKTIEFIQTVESSPILWDPSHVNYKNRKKKHKATEQLAKIFNCDSTEVMRKWKIILAQYRREKKNIVDSKASGSEYQPKWFGYAHLKFLLGRNLQNYNTPSIDEPFIEINELSSEDVGDQVKNESRESTPEIISDTLKAPNQSLKRRVVEEDSRVSYAYCITNNAKKNIEDKNQDEDDIFAAGVAIKLRKIKNERNKILVQREIDNLLYDAIISTGNYEKISVPPP